MAREKTADDVRIPWLDAVRFHLDIVKRAEEDFFSLPIGIRNADRWSALTGFAPDSLAGPWRLPQSAVESSPFLRLALERRHESIFLGGPGFIGSVRSQGSGYVDALQPLLYREVILVEKSGGLLLQPEKGRWELSPIVYQLLMRREVDTESLDASLGALIEAAEGHLDGDGASDADLADWTWEFLGGRGVPTDLIRGQKRLPAGLGGWFLFAPGNSVSVFNQYLHRDYTGLERRLQSDPEDVGGLALIDVDARKRNTKPENPESAALRALVPLNDAQRAAVQQIMSGAPVTVVSGPPGTGKSQVIVSALLNAWALGKTVLFASQNNKAVDVVIERVRKFEQDFPILVRAGAKKNSNIASVLMDVQGYAAQTGAGATAAVEDERIKTRLDEIQRQLDSKVPQRISDARTAAFRALAEHQGVRAEIDQVTAELESLLADRGLSGMTIAAAESSLEADRDWIRRLREMLRQVEEDAKERRRLEREADAVARRRDDALRTVGYESSESDWRWLAEDAPLTTVLTWMRNFESLSAGEVEELLADPDWSKAYERWKSADEAAHWAERARTASERIREIVSENVEKLRQAQQLHAVVDPTLEQLTEREVPAEVRIEAAKVEEWRTTYTLLLADPTSGGLPWSPRARRLRTLRRIERSIAGPLSNALRLIGPLDDTTREKLAEVMDVLATWLDGAQAKYGKLQELEDGITAAFDAVSTDLDRLGHDRRSWTIQDSDGWLAAAVELDRTADLADSAAVAWEKRNTQQRTQRELRTLMRDLTRILADSPLAARWAATEGRDFATAARALADDPKPENFGELRRRQLRGEVRALTEAWRVAGDAARELERLHAALADLPQAAHRLRDWTLDRPGASLLELPETDPDPAQLEATANGISETIERWKEHERSRRPDLDQRADETLDYAVRMLRQAGQTLREADSSTDLSLIDAVVAEPEQDWPQEELAELFDEYQVARLEATRAGLELQLQSIAFESAKASWIDRLHEDEESYAAIESLQRAMQKSLKLEPRSHEDFRNALRLVPIWTTTALSAQSIPLEPGLFDVVIIDEASQCTLTNVLPLIYRAKSLAVIGDMQQLNPIPTIRASEERALALKHDLTDFLEVIGHDGNNVYQTAVHSLPRTSRDVTMLVEHFRSHPLIIGFSNRAVYQQRLELKKEPGQTRLPIASGVHVHDVHGSAKKSKSWLNETEAQRVADVVADLRSEKKHRNISIGVVTPFRSQKEHIRSLLDARGIDSGVLVDTAHAFQGDERDIMVFSPVVGPGIESGSAVWVGTPPNLVNVALTRAREALIVVANLDYCAGIPGILSDLAQYCRQIDLLREESPAELELFSWLILRGLTPEVHPVIGDVEVDFLLRTKTGIKVVVEVDGRAYHKDRPAQDRARDAFLQGQGFTVLRVPAREINETPFDVLHRIESALKAE